MKKFTLLSIMFLSGISNAAGSTELIGKWSCEFKSEYIDGSQKLMISDDSSYELVTNAFGAKMIDTGKWNLKGNELHLNREFHEASGGKKKSESEFVNTITKLDKDNLAYASEKAQTVCVKQ